MSNPFNKVWSSSSAPKEVKPSELVKELEVVDSFRIRGEKELYRVILSNKEEVEVEVLRTESIELGEVIPKIEVISENTVAADYIRNVVGA